MSVKSRKTSFQQRLSIQSFFSRTSHKNNKTKNDGTKKSIAMSNSHTSVENNDIVYINIDGEEKKQVTKNKSSPRYIIGGPGLRRGGASVLKRMVPQQESQEQRNNRIKQKRIKRDAKPNGHRKIEYRVLYSPKNPLQYHNSHVHNSVKMNSNQPFSKRKSIRAIADALTKKKLPKKKKLCDNNSSARKLQRKITETMNSFVNIDAVGQQISVRFYKAKAEEEEEEACVDKNENKGGHKVKKTEEKTDEPIIRSIFSSVCGHANNSTKETHRKLPYAAAATYCTQPAANLGNAITTTGWLLRRQLFGSTNHRLSQLASHVVDREILLKNLCSQYKSHDVMLNNNFNVGQRLSNTTSRRRIRTLKFDREGVLLASGRTDGFLAIYDIDECSWKQQQYDTASAFGRNANKMGDASDQPNNVEPYVLLNTRNDISRVLWNDLRDDASLACSYVSKGCVDIFDLETASNDPDFAGANPRDTLTVRRKRGTRGSGQNDIFYINPHCIVALARDGALRFWDIRAHSRAPAWVVENAPPCAQSTLHSMCLSVDKDMIFCSGAMAVNAWDPRKLVSPVMSTELKPAAGPRYDLGSQAPLQKEWRNSGIINRIFSNPLNRREWAIVTSHNFVGQYDFIAKRFTACHLPGGNLIRPPSHFTQRIPACFSHSLGRQVLFVAHPSILRPAICVIDAEGFDNGIVEDFEQQETHIYLKRPQTSPSFILNEASRSDPDFNTGATTHFYPTHFTESNFVDAIAVHPKSDLLVAGLARDAKLKTFNLRGRRNTTSNAEETIIL